MGRRVPSAMLSLLGGLLGGLLWGCFQDSADPCALDTKGCACEEQTECGAGQLCGNGFCMPEDCSAGEVYCGCDAGSCMGDAVCHMEAVCLPPDQVPGSTGGGEGGSGVTGVMTSVADSGDAADVPDDDADQGDDAPACAGIGEECGDGAACCTECMQCSGGVCEALTGEAGSCGPCQACDATGQCGIAEGQPCEGPTLDCSQYVFGLVASNGNSDCYAKAGTASARCNGLGECVDAQPSDCPNEPGVVLATCDDPCLKSGAACTPDTAAAGVSTSSLCHVNTEQPGCPDLCTMNTAWTFHDRWCSSNGQCTDQSSDSCGTYTCILDEGGCLDSCIDDDDCYVQTGAHCDAGTCLPN